MKAITLRNLPPELAQRIEEESTERGTSLNKTIIRLLSEALFRSKSEKRQSLHHDLDNLAGSWTQEEAEDFDTNLQSQRTIDNELWQ